jgi:hypothetical protein
VQKPFLIAGGGAPEIEVSRQLGSWAKTLLGMESYCIKAFAEAMEVRPHPWTCQQRLILVTSPGVIFPLGKAGNGLRVGMGLQLGYHLLKLVFFLSKLPRSLWQRMLVSNHQNLSL